MIDFFIEFFQFKLILDIFNLQVKGSHRNEIFIKIMQNITKKFLEKHMHSFKHTKTHSHVADGKSSNFGRRFYGIRKKGLFFSKIVS